MGVAAAVSQEAVSTSVGARKRGVRSEETPVGTAATNTIAVLSVAGEVLVLESIVEPHRCRVEDVPVAHLHTKHAREVARLRLGEGERAVADALQHTLQLSAQITRVDSHSAGTGRSRRAGR